MLLELCKKQVFLQVWNALGILDAANIDEPETSPDVYANMIFPLASSKIGYLCLILLIFYRIEIYSLRPVPKKLAGKAQGWNSEWLLSIEFQCFFFLGDEY